MTICPTLIPECKLQLAYATMKRTETPPNDDYQIRCPRLGHQIAFSYCRVENKGLPCFKAVDCWFEHFEAEPYLKAQLTPEEWDKAFNTQTKPKVFTLLDLIEKAKQRQKL